MGSDASVAHVGYCDRCLKRGKQTRVILYFDGRLTKVRCPICGDHFEGYADECDLADEDFEWTGDDFVGRV